MKKILSFLLAAALMATMAVPAFADAVPTESVTGDTSKDVTAQYETGDVDTNPATVYSVTVAWTTGGNLTYKDGKTTYEWNAEDTKYVESTEATGTWSGAATVGITITNNSNAAITATAAFEQASGITATATYTDSQTATIASAAKDTVLTGNGKNLQGAPETGTITASVEVTSGVITSTNNKVGTITVTIEKVA